MIAPERPAREPAPIMPFPGVIPYAGPWGYHLGRGRGGNPLPVDKNHTGLSQSAPPRSGVFRGESLCGAQAWEGEPGYRSPLSSTPPALRAPPPHPIAPERPARGAGPDYALHRYHPIHRTVGISPGEGPGREPPPRRQKPYRPFPKCPAPERALSW